jgi:hypothetical protein
MRRLFLRFELIVVLVVAVCIAVLSASSRPASRPDLQLTSGPGDTLTLSNSREGAAVLSLGGVRPGDSLTDTVTLGNTGTIPGDITLSTSNLLDTPGSGGGELSGELDLLIRDITSPGSPATVYDGKIAALTPVSLGALAAGDSRTYEFTVSFPDAGPGAENAYQGSAMSVQFDWAAVNDDDDGDMTPPDTTITSAPPALSASAAATFGFSADEPGSTFECSLDGGAYATCSSPAVFSGLADGAHTFSVRATDAADNTDATPATNAWSIDATAPSASLADPGAYLRGTVALNASADDGTGSGVASLVIQRSAAGAGSWTTVGTNWNTSNVADGAYDLRVHATDNVGNAANSAVRTVTVDNTPPALATSNPLDGTVVSSAGSVAITANEALGNVDAEIDGSAALPVVAGNSATFAGPFDDEPHTLSGELVDLAGNRTEILVHFTVWSLAAADYPWVEKNAFAAAGMTLTAANDEAEVTVPVNAWTGGPAGDWLVVRIDPRPAGALSGGFETAGDIYDVTAYWALDGGNVHNFAKALDLTIEGEAATIVPATFENGEWRAIPRVPSGQTLPSGWSDGYYTSGADVHVLTKHLSSFSLLEDVQAPSKPKRFSGSRKNGKLALKWKAASDNAAVGAYLVYAKGALVKTLGASARSADMGRYRASDARTFQVAARDTAGNVGAKTGALVVVPSVRNLTLTDARKRLTARGLQTGTVRYAYTDAIASGRVIRGLRSGLVAKGTSVGLRVSRGFGPRTPSTTSTTSPPPPSSGGTPTSFPSSPGAAAATSTPSTQPAPPAMSEPGASADPSVGPEEVQPESFIPGEEGDEPSGLRRLLGLTLLGGAFLAAGAVALRARGPRMPKAPEQAIVEPLMFWDQRLARTVWAAARRLIDRA